MIIAFIVCISIVVLIGALLLCRIGIALEYTAAGIQAQARVGLLRITLLPQTKKRRKRLKKQENEESKQYNLIKNHLQSGGSLSQLKELLELVLEALGGFFRHLQVEYLRLHYTFAGQPDPAKAALECGTANIGGDVIGYLLESHLIVKERQVSAEVDFCSEHAKIYAAASCSVRVGAALAIVFKLLKGYLNWKKRQSQTA